MEEKSAITVSNKLVCPEDFKFPYPPYDIQLDFMKNLYNAIEERKIGIFESPTGTGKSLSIICGAINWLRDHEKREIANLEEAVQKVEPESSPSSDWLSAQMKVMANDFAVRQLKLQLSKIHARNEKIENIRLQTMDKTRRCEAPQELVTELNEKDNHIKSTEELDDVLLEEFSDLLIESDKSIEEEHASDDLPITKIIYCSRTHSQLSQFINELQKTKFSEDTRLVHLASRQSYCINKRFQNITNISTLNEKCLELQLDKDYKTTAKDVEGKSVKRQKPVQKKKCPHMKGVNDFSEKIISQVMDVETITQTSKKFGTCPYYATRSTIPFAQIIVIPYHTLLHKGSREASGLLLDNNVVIIDEAHNLLETVSHIHSCQITGLQLVHAHSQLSNYRDKYASKFSAVNLLYLNQLIHIMNALIKLIRERSRSDLFKVSNTRIYNVTDFVTDAEIDNYNLFKLLNFCKQSKLTHKLLRFSDVFNSSVKVEQRDAPCGIKEFLQDINKPKISTKSLEMKMSEMKALQLNNSTSEEIASQPLAQITSFMSCLTQDYKDGRIVLTVDSTIGKSVLKYLLLEPATVIADIFNKARSVILAGGTMEPVDEFKERLFNICEVPSDRILHFSCGHVIPKENILPIIMSKGPTGKQLDFSFNSRSSTTMLNEIGRLLINVCNIVPSGVVCFFPSYEYENEVFDYIEKNGIIKSILNKKKVFREPKKSSEVERVLSDFAKVIQNPKKDQVNGALLFSVVGGKLSEGLNFSDDLGRCVIVIGMPYPNLKSPELQEKMKFLEEHSGPNAGKIHYENLCMKAVNQTVGRSIRHRGDYSSVLLVDHRYSRPNIFKLLPKWIQNSLIIENNSFGRVLVHLSKFFKYHKGNAK